MDNIEALYHEVAARRAQLAGGPRVWSGRVPADECSPSVPGRSSVPVAAQEVKILP